MEMLIDGRLGCEYNAKQLERLALTASFCIRSSATWRPSMSEVIPSHAISTVPYPYPYPRG